MAGPSQAYKGVIKNGGTSTATTGEACTNTTGNSYQITSSSKRVIDPNVARTWYDDATPITPTSEDLNNGTATFGSAPGGSVTVDCNYIPLSALGQIRKATASIKGQQADVSTIDTYGYTKRIGTLVDFEVTLDIFEDNTTALYGSTKLATLLTTRIPLFVQIDAPGTGSKVLRAWMVPNNADWELDPANALVVGVSLSLNDRGNNLAPAGLTYGAP